MGNYLIVGGSKGIGSAIVEKLCLENHTVINMSREEGSPPPGVEHISFDVLKDDIDLNQLPGELDGFVYCPGSIVLKPFKSLKSEQFLADFQINVLGAVRSIQSILPLLGKSNIPSSIVLFSTVAVGLGMPYHASIASSKGAIEGLVKTLAAEFSPKIRVNAIAPSLTDTPLAASLISNADRKQKSAEMHPLKRYGNIADMAAMATFLLTPESSWITGQIFAVDGGLSTLKPQ